MNDIIITILSSIPLGLVLFITLTKGINAHLRGFFDKIRFFIWPFPPQRMIIIKELDGEHKIFYDDEFTEVAGEDKTIVKTIYGDNYVTEMPFSHASISRSMFSTWGPDGHYTPYSLAWRWAVAASFSVYLLYYALIRGLFSESWQQFTLSSIAFISGFSWIITNVMRMQDRTISYAWYHSIGINPPHQHIIPVTALSSIELTEYLTLLKREIVINVPDDIIPVLKTIEQKTGSKSLAAVIIAKLAMARAWRQALAQAFRESFMLRKAGETAAMIRMRQRAGGRLLYIVLAFLIGLALGGLLGAVFDVSVTPAEPAASTAEQITPAVQPPPPYTIENVTNNTITPAEPPPPPPPEEGGG